MRESVREARPKTDDADLADFFEADFFAGLGGSGRSSVVAGWRGSNLISARTMGKRA